MQDPATEFPLNDFWALNPKTRKPQNLKILNPKTLNPNQHANHIPKDAGFQIIAYINFLEVHGGSQDFFIRICMNMYIYVPLQSPF